MLLQSTTTCCTADSEGTLCCGTSEGGEQCVLLSWVRKAALKLGLLAG